MSRETANFSMYSDMSTAHDGFLVVEEELGQGPGQLGLAHARGAQEQEGADGLLGLLEARAGAPDGLGDDFDGLVLADDALVQDILHVHELLGLGLGQAGDGTPVHLETTTATSSAVMDGVDWSRFSRHFFLSSSRALRSSFSLSRRRAAFSYSWPEMAATSP